MGCEVCPKADVGCDVCPNTEVGWDACPNADFGWDDCPKTDVGWEGCPNTDWPVGWPNVDLPKALVEALLLPAPKADEVDAKPPPAVPLLPLIVLLSIAATELCFTACS